MRGHPWAHAMAEKIIDTVIAKIFQTFIDNLLCSVWEEQTKQAVTWRFLKYFVKHYKSLM